jgi:hypothetical protein
MGVIEAGEKAAFFQFRVGMGIGRKQLQGDLACQSRVPRPVHGSAGAPPDLAAHLEVSPACSDRGIGRGVCPENRLAMDAGNDVDDAKQIESGAGTAGVRVRDGQRPAIEHNLQALLEDVIGRHQSS